MIIILWVYILTLSAVFSKNDENSEIFRQIKIIESKFTIGKFLWIKLLEYLASIKDKIKYMYITSWDWNFFIFNKSTKEAETYHKNNQMKDITPEMNTIILNTKNERNTQGVNLYDLYHIEIEN